MIPLQDQQQFENDIWTCDSNMLESRTLNPSSAGTRTAAPAAANKTFFIYFTAPWCGACKRLDLPTLTAMTANVPNVQWYKCDIDDNDYTASFCQIRQIPTFLCIKNKQVINRITSSVNQTVAEWIIQNLQ